MPTRIADRDRFGEAGGTSTRYTINRSRGSSSRNPSQIDILKIDDSEARKTLQDFFNEVKRETNSAADDIRKMWTLSIGYSSKYKRSAIEDLNEIEDERDRAHKKEIDRINKEFEDKDSRDKALYREMKKYNLDKIKYIKEINAADRQGLEIQRQTEELRKKYAGTRLGKRIQSDLDTAQKLKIDIAAEYDRIGSKDLSRDELAKIIDSTDDLEGQLDEVNRRIERTIDRSEKRTDALKTAIKQFLSDSVTILTHNYLEGISGYFNSYENTFTEFSGRLGYNYDQTRQFYSDIISETYSNGMDTAISINKELIPAIRVALTQGFTGKSAIAKAMADEQSRILMPWLETSTEAWVNMSFNMSKQNIDLLKSQQLQLQTTKEGNRLLQSGVINSMTSEMEPLLRNIDLNTGGASNLSKEAQAMMASLVKQGMSTQDAYSLVLNAVNVQKDIYGALTSGDVTKILMGQAAAEGKGLFGQFDNLSSLYDIASRGSSLDASALNDILNLNMTAGTPEIAREIADAIRGKGEFINTSDKKWEDVLKDINGKLSATKSQENKQQNDTAIVGEWISAIPQGDKWFTSMLNFVQTLTYAVIGGKVTSSIVDILSSGKIGSGIVSTLKGLFGTGGSFTSAGSLFGKFISSAGWVAMAYLVIDSFYKLWKSKNKVDDYGKELTETSSGALSDNKYMSVNEAGESSTLEKNPGIVEIGKSSDNAYRTTINKANEDLGPVDKFIQWTEGLLGFSEDAIRQGRAEMISTDAASGNRYKVALTNTAQNNIDTLGDHTLSQMLKAYIDSGLLTDDWMWAWLGGSTNYTINRNGNSALSTAINEFKNNGRLIVPRSSAVFTGYRVSDFDASGYYSKNNDLILPQYISDEIDLINSLVSDRRRDIEQGNYNPETDKVTDFTKINDPTYQDIPAYKYFMYSNYKDDIIDYRDKDNGKYREAIDKLLKYPIEYYSVGKSYLYDDELAMLHEGERVLTKSQNKVFNAIGGTALLALGSNLIDRLLGFNINNDSNDSDNDSDDISREDMTETLVSSLEKVTSAISSLSNNGINYSNRTLPRVSNGYNSSLVNLTSSISSGK